MRFQICAAPNTALGTIQRQSECAIRYFYDYAQSQESAES